MRARNVLVLLSAILLEGCVSPNVWTLDHSPPESIRIARSVGFKAVVLPWTVELERIARGRGSVSLIPLIFYSTIERQNGGFSTGWSFPTPLHPGYLPSAPILYPEVPPLLARYFRETGTFDEVQFLAQDYQPPADADYIIKGTLHNWSLTGWRTAYGISIISFPIAFLSSLPIRGDTYEASYTLSIEEASSGEVVFSKRYQGEAGRVRAITPGPLAWIFDIRPTRGNFEAEHLFPLISSSMKDFVTNVQVRLGAR